jgi:hypothetical protein
VSKRNRVIAVAATLLVAVVLVSTKAINQTSSDNDPFSKPVAITAGPAGLKSGTAPSTSGLMWLLASNLKGANLQRVREKDGRVLGIVPLPKEASTVSESSGGYLLVGLNGLASGAVRILSAKGGATLGSIPTSGPVIDMVTAADGVTAYILSKTRSARVVDVINLETRRIVSHVPVPLQTSSIAVSPDQMSMYSLEPNGLISLIDVGTSRITDRFSTDSYARHLAASLDGTKLLVLKGALNANNVSVIDIVTQRTVAVVPAPANTVWIQSSLDGSQIVNFIGTPTMGNVQIFQIP